MSSPDPGGSANANVLSDVTITSAKDAWAVGDYSTGSVTDPLRTLITHWNGITWSQVPSPSPPDSSLSGVAATSATNAWAVGEYANGPTGRTLILHWNGKNWTRVPSPNPGGVIAFTDLLDVWAAGTYRSSSSDLRSRCTAADTS